MFDRSTPGTSVIGVLVRAGWTAVVILIRDAVQFQFAKDCGHVSIGGNDNGRTIDFRPEPYIGTVNAAWQISGRDTN